MELSASENVDVVL